MGMKTIGFLGKNGGKVKKLCNIPIVVKSNITARIQESHIFLGHYIFEKVENNLIKKIKI
jgi:D-sedoheptulose 7-phosphate isomerase